jgi:hypothetical protein
MDPQGQEVIVIEDSEDDEHEPNQDQEVVFDFAMDAEQDGLYNPEVITVDDSSEDDMDEGMNDFSEWVGSGYFPVDGDWDHWPSATGLTVGEILFNREMLYTQSVGERLFLEAMNID